MLSVGQCPDTKNHALAPPYDLAAADGETLVHHHDTHHNARVYALMDSALARGVPFCKANSIFSRTVRLRKQ